MIETLYSFFMDLLQSWGNYFSSNQTTIDLLSVSVCVLTALMMWLAYQRVRSEEWIKYFALTFVLLAVQYLSRVLISSDIASPMIAQILSIGTNLASLAAVRDIQNKKPLFFKSPAQTKADQAAGRLIPMTYWVLAAVAVLTSLAGLVIKRAGVPGYISEVVGNSGDSVFSAITLFVVGYAIVVNLSLRRSHLRPVALLVALGYSAVQIGFGLTPYLAHAQRMSVEAILVVLALGFKIVFSVAVYLLVIRFFETFNELRQLQETGFGKRQEYLSSDGVAEVIGNRLVRSTRRLRNKEKSIPPDLEGFVNVVLRLPGEKNRRVACIWWPNSAKEKRAKVLDWTPAGSFTPLGEPVDPKKPQGERNYLEWEWATVFLDLVLGDESHSEFIWPEDQMRLSEDIKYNGRMTTVANVVIRADGAAIGCLQVGRCNSTFSQMAIRQLIGVAKLLTPSVQAYRELAGLDNMSIRFAERQADETFYSSERATDEIAAIIHDVFGSTVTRFCIDFGFAGPELVYKIKPGMEQIRIALDEKLVDHERKDIETPSHNSNDNNLLAETLLHKRWQNEMQLSREIKWRDYPFGFDYADTKRRTEYRILKKILSARVTETLSYKPVDEPGQFDMGHLVLVVDKIDAYNQPALGTTYLHRKGASTLAADAYLDFQRDYHNEILKKLSQELSSKRINIDEWFEPIQRLLTKDAALCWVVAEQNGAKDLLGDDKGKSIISRLDQLQSEMRFCSATQPEIEAHYVLARAEYNTHHVLKLKLSDSDTFIWLGVHRNGFGSELDFASPWKTFLVNFVQIADASLSRITFPERFELQLEASQLQSIIASLATTGTVIHQFRNMITGQLLSIRELLATTELQEKVQQRLILMHDSADRMMEVFESISRLTKSEERRPCQLIEAARHAFRLFEISLIMRRIKSEIDIPEGLFADVPFNIAALALATLVGNSKDAIQGEGGTIRIEANRNGDNIYCRVIDNGVGIHSEIRSKIFEPKDRTKRYGTGLGLFLTAHSLSDNASSISLTKSDESGTVFTIRFPLGKGVN